MKGLGHIVRTGLRLYYPLLAGGLYCSPVNCQVASVSMFQEASVQASVGGVGGVGATMSASANFTLYDLSLRLGRRPYVGLTTKFAARSTSALPDLGAASAECGIGQAPSPRLLSPRIRAGRHAFWRLIASAECRFGLPKGLMDSVVLAESGYDPSVVSSAGAAGLAQLMPATALQLGVVDRFDPGANVLAGARYLRQLLDNFGGNVPLALAAYNAGPSAVRRVRGVPPNGETPGYVRRVLGYWTAPGIGPMGPALPARQIAQMLGFGPSLTN